MAEDDRAAGRISVMRYKVNSEFLRLNYSSTSRKQFCEWFSQHDCPCYMNEDELTNLFRYLEALK